MSDLFGNHIVGFPMRRLIFEPTKQLLFSHGGSSEMDDPGPSIYLSLGIQMDLCRCK